MLVLHTLDSKSSRLLGPQLLTLVCYTCTAVCSSLPLHWPPMIHHSRYHPPWLSRLPLSHQCWICQFCASHASWTPPVAGHLLMCLRRNVQQFLIDALKYLLASNANIEKEAEEAAGKAQRDTNMGELGGHSLHCVTTVKTIADLGNDGRTLWMLKGMVKLNGLSDWLVFGCNR